MPEEDPSMIKSLINESDEEQNVEEESRDKQSEKGQTSKSPNFAEIVHNFFNRQDHSPKSSKKEKSGKKKKFISGLARKMNINVKKSASEKCVFPEDENNEASTLIPNGNRASQTCGQSSSRNDGNQESRRLLLENGDSKVSGRSSVEKGELGSNVLKTDERGKLKNAASSAKQVEDESFMVYSQDSQCTTQKFKEIFTRRRSVSVYSETEYEKLRESFGREREEERGEISHRLRSQRNTFMKQNETKSSPRLIHDQSSTSGQSTSRLNFKKFIQNNIKKLRLPRFHSGSFVILNDKNTSVKFTELQPDSKIAEECCTRSISNPNLLSGGQVVLEGCAGRYKPLDHYADDPVVFNELPSNIQFLESSPFTPTSTKPRVFARSISGGCIIDDSSKCSSLPELFPSKNPSPGPNLYQPSVERHHSGGGLIESSDVQGEIFVDLLSQSIQFETGTSTSQPLSPDNNDGSRANSGAESMNRIISKSISSAGPSTSQHLSPDDDDGSRVNSGAESMNRIISRSISRSISSAGPSTSQPLSPDNDGTRVNSGAESMNRIISSSSVGERSITTDTGNTSRTNPSASTRPSPSRSLSSALVDSQSKQECTDRRRPRRCFRR